ncbi:MAG: group 1 glycosyl transferase [Candidatus Berkelbacteria bacterium]|nr:group 1 glycosyl transferase [Candidatus Berkelbacteria bacterium]
MKIAIDTQTTLGQKTGFGFYVKNLVEALEKVDSKDEYVKIFPKTEKDFSTPQRLFWDQVTFPRRAGKAKVDLLHQPCFSAPLFYRGKIVVTCHDLISIFFPENLPLASRLFYSKWMPFSYRRADMIIAISEHTKRDIMALLKIPEDKITVIHSAASKDFRPIKSKKELARVKKKYGTGKNYILDVGTLEPRKNLPFLVRAYALAVREGINEKLVITGKKGWYYEDLFKLVDKLSLQDKVIFTGYVEEKDLPALYSGARAFVFPSIYEGFGLPPLEAMACGVPVISSNTSSLSEVVDNAGILLQPKDERLWAAKIVKILRDPKLALTLSALALRQSKKFSWEESARKTINVYKEVLKRQK